MNRLFAEILILSKRIASDLLKNKEVRDLNEADYFREEDRNYIRNQLSNKDEVQSRKALIRQIDRKNDFKRVRSKINQPKQIKIWHYAAAAAVILFFVASELLQGFLNLDNNPARKISISIEKPTIEAGSNKAFLVLEDGEIIELDEKNAFQNDYLKSSGDELVVLPKEHGSIGSFNSLNIPRGGQFHLVLSDGTNVWLNSETLLKFPKAFTPGQDRVVELIYGEAYFDVTPSELHGGSPFKVINVNQSVEVLGTEFNIKAYPDDTTVLTTLVEGKVNVEHGNSGKILRPNEQSILDLENLKMSVVQVDALSESSWKRGLFSFRGKPLKEIMKVVSRWYDVDVEFQNSELETIPFRGVLGKNQNIEELLSTIKSLSIIDDYEVRNRKIILK